MIMQEDWTVDRNACLLVTGASGFVGSRVVGSLLRLGFKNLRCLVRPGSEAAALRFILTEYPENRCRVMPANLLSRQDCVKAVEGVSIVYHLVAGRGKSFPGCFQGSVITTRNLLDAAVQFKNVQRFVNISSFAVYSNLALKKGALWDESCPLEDNLEERYDAYVYGKIKQDELVLAYSRKYGIPVTIVRPGIVFGPGKTAIPGFVGMDTFGIFVRVGGRGELPLTYVDNCADAIALAGLVRGVDGEVFNVVDDDLPKSRMFLREYKKRVRHFRSIWIPYGLARFFCFLWERYSKRSRGQLPPVFNRRMCSFAWKGHRYSNSRLQERLGWKCRVPMKEALARYYEYQKNG